MKFFYDTEFVDDGRTIDLISIGIVAEDGREYYAVNAGADWKRVHQHPWLAANVVPHLPIAGSPLYKPQALIAAQVADFLRPQRGAEAIGSLLRGRVDMPELWAWYGAYDHVALAQLWGPMAQLPRWVPMWTNDLRQEQHRLGDPAIPAQAPGSQHDALADARHNRVVHAALTEYARIYGRA